MKLCFIVVMLICVSFADVFAQEREAASDSILGGDTLRVNAATLKAINEGTFLNSDRLPLRQSVSSLPILDDFSEYIKADRSWQPLPLDSLPPAVFWLYQADATGYQIREAVYKPKKSLVVKDRITLLNKSLYMKVGTGNLYMDEVRDGQRRGTANVSLSVNFSMEDGLRHIFWKSERDKKRNRKREATWKYYNSYP